MKNCRVFFEILPKLSVFVNTDDCIGKFTTKSIRLQLVFLSKKKFEVNKKSYFSSEKWEFQVIVLITVLTHSSAMIFKPMRYTGCIYDYAQSFSEEYFLIYCGKLVEFMIMLTRSCMFFFDLFSKNCNKYSTKKLFLFKTYIQSLFIAQMKALDGRIGSVRFFF